MLVFPNCVTESRCESFRRHDSTIRKISLSFEIRCASEHASLVSSRPHIRSKSESQHRSLFHG